MNNFLFKSANERHFSWDILSTSPSLSLHSENDALQNKIRNIQLLYYLMFKSSHSECKIWWIDNLIANYEQIIQVIPGFEPVTRNQTQIIAYKLRTKYSPFDETPMKRIFWLLVVNEYLSERSQHPPYNLHIVFSLFSFIALDCIHGAVPAYHSTTLNVGWWTPMENWRNQVIPSSYSRRRNCNDNQSSKMTTSAKRSSLSL